jgi:hypothetical protein
MLVSSDPFNDTYKIADRSLALIDQEALDTIGVMDSWVHQ